MKAHKAAKRHGPVSSTAGARDRVREYCKDNKVSQKTFAELSECSPTTLSRFMSGKIHGVPCEGNGSYAYAAIKKFFKKSR